MIDVLSVYRAPFRKDPYGHFIWDADHHMVADMGGPGGAFRTRGWGRIQYMKDAEKIHDELTRVFGIVTAKCALNHELCVDALNRLWEDQCCPPSSSPQS